MISKYHNDFVISQIVFCGIENQCRDISQNRIGDIKNSGRIGDTTVLVVISQNRFCNITKSDKNR